MLLETVFIDVLTNNFTMGNLDIRKIFGENVRYYRKKAGLSQEQLAEKLEITPGHLGIIERGAKFASYKLLEKMIEVLNVNPSNLFYSSESESINKTKQDEIDLVIQHELKNASYLIRQKIRDLM